MAIVLGVCELVLGGINILLLHTVINSIDIPQYFDQTHAANTL